MQNSKPLIEDWLKSITQIENKDQLWEHCSELGPNTEDFVDWVNSEQKFSKLLQAFIQVATLGHDATKSLLFSLVSLVIFKKRLSEKAVHKCINNDENVLNAFLTIAFMDSGIDPPKRAEHLRVLMELYRTVYHTRELLGGLSSKHPRTGSIITVFEDAMSQTPNPSENKGILFRKFDELLKGGEAARISSQGGVDEKPVEGPGEKATRIADELVNAEEQEQIQLEKKSAKNKAKKQAQKERNK